MILEEEMHHRMMNDDVVNSQEDGNHEVQNEDNNVDVNVHVDPKGVGEPNPVDVELLIELAEIKQYHIII